MKPLEKGKLYLIPTLLGASDINILPPIVIDTVQRLKYFIVEDEKSARKFLKSVGVLPPYDDLHFFTLNKHTSSQEKHEIFIQLSKVEAGIISEAGCPVIADPGAAVVKMAHQVGIQVIPLPGPSSILLALMASGATGQNFTFHGYLPISSSERQQKIKWLQEMAVKSGYTQIFIETPFRNESMVNDVIKTADEEIFFSIATDLTLDTEEIHTASIQQWQTKKLPPLRGRPSVFLLWAHRRSKKRN